MRSPFTGMDPYLEDPGGWPGVHDGLITRLRTELNRQLRPAFVADAGTSVYIVAADEQRWVFPDIYIVETRRAEQVARGHVLPRRCRCCSTCRRRLASRTS
jgi:Protein of unknown function (DUF4058)